MSPQSVDADFRAVAVGGRIYHSYGLTEGKLPTGCMCLAANWYVSQIMLRQRAGSVLLGSQPT